MAITPNNTAKHGVCYRETRRNPPDNTANTNNTENADAPARKARWINTPVFGRCKLVPHTMDEEPSCMLGYVERRHRPGTLTVALYAKGEWRTRDLKRFGGTVIAWYSLEREDGRPVL